MDKIKMAAVIKSFGVTFTYQRKVADKREHGQTVPGGLSEPIEVTEPIMPFAQGNSPAASGHSSGGMMMVNGQLEQADLVWYSNESDVPIGSQVLLHGEAYRVMNSDNWQDFSDVAIYYLKGLKDYVEPVQSV